MQDIQSIIHLLDISIDEDGENNIMSGNIIKSGYNSQIDSYRETITQAHNWLSSYQSQIAAETSITSIKIKYTNASGYFIEIPKSQMTNVPDSYIHKQTLVNASRYVTQELLDFQDALFEAQNNMAEEEYKVFQDIRKTLMSGYAAMKKLSQKTAYTDFLVSLSHVAYKKNYVCPKVSKNFGYDIVSGRHPVIETIEKDFIHNDLVLDKKNMIHVVTGPNMGGKSTFLRQNALIVIMAHMGSYVPAREASIGLTDKVFSRVGANDNLFLGKSTFMVEMQEVAHILNNATRKSFIIIDEVGRGTSTYDGMSLAWGILKHLHDDIGVKTLFATHYHEIIDESGSLSGVRNFSVAVGENEENLVFLRKIVPGGIKKSYGLEVAQIAGIQQKILQEARAMMLQHKEGVNNKSEQLSLTIENTQPQESSIEKAISEIDIDNLTPFEALHQIILLQKELENK